MGRRLGGGNGEGEMEREQLEGGDGEGATGRGRREGGKGEGKKKGQEEECSKASYLVIPQPTTAVRHLYWFISLYNNLSGGFFMLLELLSGLPNLSPEMHMLYPFIQYSLIIYQHYLIPK